MQHIDITCFPDRHFWRGGYDKADLAALAAALAAAGHPARTDEPLEGYERAYVDDPFGNRIELMQRL